MNYYAKLAEEKRNSVVTRGTVHGHKYEVERMSDGSYMGYVYDEEDYPIFKTGLHSTSSGAEQEIKSKVFNSKDNSKVLDAEVVSYSDPDTHERYYKVWLITDEGYRNPRIFKTFQEADREAARIQREVKSKKSKENSMNHYEKIIQEKMNSTQVIEKGTIKGAEYFIEKVTETVKYPRPFEQVRYIGKLKKDGRVIIYTPRHENLDTCKRALEKLVDENKSMFNNSKGETNMGYYADLIKEKKNADPEESMRKLQALKPIVEAFKRKGMTKHEVAMRLMQERDITETLAQQCVDTWY